MQRELIPFVSEEQWLEARSRDLTSTTISALFGFHPWITEFQLHHTLKLGDVGDEFEPNERSEWGKLLQDSIANGVAREEGWQLRPMREYIRLPQLRIGSSFDFRVFANPDDGDTDADDLLEIKNVDGLIFRNNWRDEEGFGLVAPEHIEIQAQHEMLCSGLQLCHIRALVGGNSLARLRRPFQPDVGEAIVKAAQRFWNSDEPEPDFARDSVFIAQHVYGFSTPGKIIDADEEVAALFREYAGHRAIESAADKAKKEIKARILMRIGGAERVNHSEFTLSAREVGETEVAAFTRKGFRSFKLYEKEKK